MQEARNLLHAEYMSRIRKCRGITGRKQVRRRAQRGEAAQPTCMADGVLLGRCPGPKSTTLPHGRGPASRDGWGLPVPQTAAGRRAGTTPRPPGCRSRKSTAAASSCRWEMGRAGGGQGEETRRGPFGQLQAGRQGGQQPGKQALSVRQHQRLEAEGGAGDGICSCPSTGPLRLPSCPYE